jgi:hypothetical protein
MTTKRRIAAILIILFLGIQALIRLAHRETPSRPISAIDGSPAAGLQDSRDSEDCPHWARIQDESTGAQADLRTEEVSPEDSADNPQPEIVQASKVSSPRPLEEWKTPLEVAFTPPVTTGNTASRPVSEVLDRWQPVHNSSDHVSEPEAKSDKADSPAPQELAQNEAVPDSFPPNDFLPDEAVTLSEMLSPEGMPPLPPVAESDDRAAAIIVADEAILSQLPPESSEPVIGSVPAETADPALPPVVESTSESTPIIADSEVRWSAVKSEPPESQKPEDAQWTALPPPPPAPVSESVPVTESNGLLSEASPDRERVSAPESLERRPSESEVQTTQAGGPVAPPPSPVPPQELTQKEKLKLRTDGRMKILNKSVTTIAIAQEPKPDALPLNLARLEAEGEPLVVVTSQGWIDIRPSRYPVPFFYQPLYFENPDLERCGHGYGIFQSVLSGGLFLGETITAPFHMGALCPTRLIESPGDCPTGCRLPCIPIYDYTPVQIARGTAVQAAAVVGAVFLLL